MNMKDVIKRLEASCRLAELTAHVLAVPSAEIAKVRDVLPLSAELEEWYLNGAPTGFEIPWSVEWLSLYHPAELIERQEGYRWTSGVGGPVDPHWDPAWLLIGDCSGDAIIADTGAQGTPVFYAFHGESIVSLIPMAPDISSFLATLAIWIGVRCVRFKKGARNEDGTLRQDLFEEFALQLRRWQALPPEYIDVLGDYVN